MTTPTEPATPPLGAEAIVGQSEAFLRALDHARTAAVRRAKTVLLVGEAGSGKELFARAIHYAGPDAHAPFVPVSCATIPRALLEAELFGEARGPFAGEGAEKPGLLELAGTGTIFLDEVTELPASLQPKLLRAIEEGRVRRAGGRGEFEVRCRFIAATNRPMEDIVPEDRLREDLLFRLNALRIRIPPLRERDGDLDLLCRHFLRTFARDRGFAVSDPTQEALAMLRAHAWPGNVRELRGVIRRAAMLANGAPIEPDHVVLRGPRGAPVGQAAGTPARIEIPAEGRSMDEIEGEALRITLEMTGGNKSAAARILGWSRPTLHRKIERHGLGGSA